MNSVAPGGWSRRASNGPGVPSAFRSVNLGVVPSDPKDVGEAHHRHAKISQMIFAWVGASSSGAYRSSRGWLWFGICRWYNVAPVRGLATATLEPTPKPPIRR